VSIEGQAEGPLIHPGCSGPGLDGVAVFDALHRRRRARDAMLYAFDPLEFNGGDYIADATNRATS
jgi:hypothetical protein